MQENLLMKYFPPSNAAMIKELAGIKKKIGELLFEYLERFGNLWDSFRHLGIPENFLIEYFLDRMIPIKRIMFDCTTGGIVMNLVPEKYGN